MHFPADLSQDNTSPEHRQLKAGQFVFNRRYELQQRLGAGGMGVVWLAFDHTEKTQVALKFLPTILIQHDNEIDRLREEVRAGKELRHPLIVATYGLELADNVAAIVLEYVAGETLKQKIESAEHGFLEPAEVAPWLCDVTTALTYLHDEAKRLHRDLKPANIILDAEGRSRLMDFGISQSIKETTGRHSQGGATQGTSNTLAYASPESLRPRHKPAVSDDIYSLGATLYELLTGTPHFYQGSPEVIALHVKTEPVPSITQRRAELVEDGANSSTGEPVPEVWERVVAACLAKQREARPKTAQAVLAMSLDSAPQSSPELKLDPALLDNKATSHDRPRPPAEASGLKPTTTLPPSPGPSSLPINPSGKAVSPVPPGISATVVQDAPQQRRSAIKLLPWVLGGVCIVALSIFALQRGQEQEIRQEDIKRRALEEARQHAPAASRLVTPSLSLPAATPVLPMPLSTTQALQMPLSNTVTIPIQGRSKTFTVTRDPAKATADMPYANKLDMLFVPVSDTNALFCIHETRVRDFAAFMAKSHYDYASGKEPNTLDASEWKQRGDGASWAKPGFEQTEDHPVTCVSWDDAKAFCAWMSTQDGHQHTLPSDAQWSFAVGLKAEAGDTPAAKGHDNQNNGIFPWAGGYPPSGSVGNYAGAESGFDKEGSATYRIIKGYTDGYARTAPVCSYVPNIFNLYDLGGNVWEWCEDDYLATSSNRRVLRGAAWTMGSESSLRSASRFAADGADRFGNYGFRCVIVEAGKGAPFISK